MTRQRGNHLHRQALPCPVVSARMHIAQRQTTVQSLDRRLIHRLLAGAIRTHGLRQKHRQRLCVWKQLFPMVGQQRFHWRQQFRTGKQIEKGVAIAVGSMATNTLLLMHTGWPPQVMGVGLATYSLSLVPAFFYPLHQLLNP